MKSFLKIGSFLLLLVLLTAEDCSDKAVELTYEERQTAMFHEMENGFEKQQPGPEALEAFEERSLQMVTEMVDYLNIYADSSLTKEFRLQAKQMLNDLFIAKEEFDSFLFSFNLFEEKENGIIYAKNKNFIHFDIISSSISESLTQQSDTSYSGNISFVLSSNIEGIKPQNRKLEIRLQRTQKQFGKNSAKVWDLFFGGINN